MSNRKLIRPTLDSARTRETPMARTVPGSGRKSGAPPAETSAETYYYLKQMGSKTPMVVILTDGEILRGWIEWYDRACVKLNRERGPNLLLMKHSIKYMYKEEEERGPERRARRAKEREARDKDRGRAQTKPGAPAVTNPPADEDDE